MDDVLDRGEKIPGFGHAIYKVTDPRAIILKEIGRKAFERADPIEPNWFAMTELMERRVFERKGLVPNVDLYSASVLYYLGFPIDLLTALFAADVQRVDLGNLDLEQFLHGLADFRLVGAPIVHDGVLVKRTFFNFGFALVVQDRIAGLVTFEGTHHLAALPGTFFRQADGLDDFKSVHVIPWSDGLRPSQTRSS